MMNSPERVFIALEHHEPDRVPKIEWLIDPNVIRKINPEWDYADVIEHTAEDVVVAWPDMKTRKIDEDTEIDEWGITKGWTPSSGTIAVPIKSALQSKDDFAHYVPPDPFADYRLHSLQEMITRFKGKKAICFFAHDSWEYAAAITGTENMLMDFVLDPAFARRVIDVVVDYQVKLINRAIDMGAEIIATGDDYCSNKGPLMSPQHFAEFILPGLKKIVSLAKSRGVYFIKHCDGNVWPILDLIIATGIDGFHPFQPDVMDIREAKKRYGEKITLVGNIDCGELLCNGSPEEVDQVVRQTILDVAPGGGYILASSNVISAGVKPENYLALLNALQKYGHYPIRKQ